MSYKATPNRALSMNLLLMEILVVAFGGAFGSVARLLLSRSIQQLIPYEQLPWGIITVNIVGCFLIGVLYGLFDLKLLLNPLWRAGLMIGILGGFTTFSSFSLDTIVFLQRGEALLAFSNIAISVLYCLMATAFGFWVVGIFA